LAIEVDILCISKEERAMKTQIARWGNSMAVRIPRAIAQEAKLRAGDHVEMAAEGSGVVRMRKKKGKHNLKDLIRGITASNLHKETDWGGAEGQELW
jgi:antitoxin MazE